MSDNEVILRLSTVALLVGFLIYMQWERARKRAALRRRFQFKGEVHPINVAPLRPRLAEVRRNYTTAAQTHVRSIQARESLVTSARQKLSGLPFFRNHPAEPEGEHHAV